MTKGDALKTIIDCWNALWRAYCDNLKEDSVIIPPRYVDKMQTAISTLEKADDRWIPVTERLPEEDKDVLITYRYKEGEGDTSHVYIDITTYGDMYFGGNPVHNILNGNRIKHWRQPFAYFASNYEVIAWRPLPKAYQDDLK